MTNKETVRKSLELTFDFVRQIIDNPSIVNQLPDKCEIEFIDKDFSSLSEDELAQKNFLKVNRSFEVVKTEKTKAKKNRIRGERKQVMKKKSGI